MKSVNIEEAKTQLSRLVERVQAGEEIVIAKSGRPAARLVPVEGVRKPIKIGGLKGRIKVPDNFNTMFGQEIEAMFGTTLPPHSARKRK